MSDPPIYVVRFLLPTSSRCRIQSTDRFGDPTFPSVLRSSRYPQKASAFLRHTMRHKERDAATAPSGGVSFRHTSHAVGASAFHCKRDDIPGDAPVIPCALCIRPKTWPLRPCLLESLNKSRHARCDRICTHCFCHHGDRDGDEIH